MSTIAASQRIKGLKSQLQKAQGDVDALMAQIKALQKEHSQKVNQTNTLRQQIQSAENDGKLKVSEHAILRYLERVKGIDLDLVQLEILSPKVMAMVEKLGQNGSYPSDGFQVVMKDGTVITVKT